MAKKILVARFSSLGDVILTAPVFKNLRQSLPDAHLTLAVKEKYAGAMENNPDIDQIIALKEGESFFSFAGKINKENFDLMIDLHNNLRSHLLSMLSNIPEILRYKKAFWERRLFVAKKIKKPELERHTIDRYLEPLKKLGIEPKFFIPEIYPDNSLKKRIQPLRILVVQTAFLGDAVLTTPIFSALKQTFPKSKISVLCTPEINEIFSDNKNIDEILVMDKRGKDRGFLSIFRWSKLLKNRFDIALLPHRSFRSAFLIWCAQIPKRIGFNISQGKWFLTDTVSFDWKTHDSERNLKLLETMGIKNIKPEIQVPLKSFSFDFDAFLKQYSIPKDSMIVGMNPGSVWKTKRWIPEYFAQVADKLIEEYHCNILLFGSPKDSEAVNAVVKSMKHTSVNLCGKTDLKSLVYLISKCQLFVTNDSGPMHLACASHIPVVAIFGPTTKELGFFPYGEKSKVIEIDCSCRPCTLHGGNQCPLGHFKCMRDVRPKMVYDACRAFLSKSTSNVQ